MSLGIEHMDYLKHMNTSYGDLQVKIQNCVLGSMLRAYNGTLHICQQLHYASCFHSDIFRKAALLRL